MNENQRRPNRVRRAIQEMIGREEPVKQLYKQITARFGFYKDIDTTDVSRTSYALARAIYFANIYQDHKTGSKYGENYLLGASFGKPIVNIHAGFVVGAPIQIKENNTITESEDNPENKDIKLKPAPVTPGKPVQFEPAPPKPYDPSQPQLVKPPSEKLDELEAQLPAENPTVANVNQWLDEQRDFIFTSYRNHLRDGDVFIVMEDDGTMLEIPPEDVDVILDPTNPDALAGYDIWTSYKDPNNPNDTLTFVDEIRRTYRRRMQVDRNDKRTEVPNTRVDFRNAGDGGLEERELPVVHLANEKEPRTTYGYSEYQSLYYLFANYHAVLAAAIKGNIYNSSAVPVIQGLKNVKQFLEQNFTKDKDGNYRIKWDRDKMLVLGEGGSAQILQGNGTASDAQILLNILFWLISQNSETPEFAFGTAVQSSKASVSEQTPMLIKKAIRKQGQLEKPMRQLIELYISRMAELRPEEFDAETQFQIDMPDILDDDLNVNIQIVNTLLEKGIITEETAMTMLNLGKYVKDFAEELKKARLQKEARNPIPTDLFGQPLNAAPVEKDQKDQSKKAPKSKGMPSTDPKAVQEFIEKNGLEKFATTYQGLLTKEQLERHVVIVS